MKIKTLRYLLAAAVILLLLSVCACSENAPDNNDNDKIKTDTESQKSSDALTWCTYALYPHQENFLKLVNKTYPEINLKMISYTGANQTGYSWAQMRAGDIPDIFITSQILDAQLAKEQLADLSGYPFVNDFSTSMLNQVEIDGGLYLLPDYYNMYGITYNKTLMEEMGWEVPTNFEQLEALCKEIRAAGLIPGVIGTQLTGNPFSAVFNLAKTSWLTTPDGVKWEQDFLAGDADAAGMWEGTMELVQKYIDIGMFTTDPEDRKNSMVVEDYLGGRKAVFFTAATPVSNDAIASVSDDELGLMPYIGEDGSKNIYMYRPSSYFGISRRLTEPGNEQKLADAVKILSLLFSQKGQEVLFDSSTSVSLSVLSSASVAEDSIVYDAQHAMWDGRAFLMTYAGWENVLADMGQAFKEWFRGENNMDAAKSIARMDELQQTYLNSADQLYFCESTADFTLEETAQLIGRAVCSYVGADAAMISLSEFHEGGEENSAGLSGRLFKGKIDADIFTTIVPVIDGEYALMEMTGAEAKALAEAGFDLYENGRPFPYVLASHDGTELKNGETYQVAFLMNGYTKETAKVYSARVEEGSLRTMLHTYLEEHQTVSPDGEP